TSSLAVQTNTLCPLAAGLKIALRPRVNLEACRKLVRRENIPEPCQHILRNAKLELRAVDRKAFREMLAQQPNNSSNIDLAHHAIAPVIPALESPIAGLLIPALPRRHPQRSSNASASSRPVAVATVAPASRMASWQARWMGESRPPVAFSSRPQSR